MDKQLFEHCWKGDVDVGTFKRLIKRMIKKGADLDVRADLKGPCDGATPLMIASMFDRVHFMEVLIDANANVNTQSVSGRTALGYARTERCCRTLINAGAALDTRDVAGCTARRPARRGWSSGKCGLLLGLPGAASVSVLSHWGALTSTPKKNLKNIFSVRPRKVFSNSVAPPPSLFLFFPFSNFSCHISREKIRRSSSGEVAGEEKVCHKGLSLVTIF